MRPSRVLSVIAILAALVLSLWMASTGSATAAPVQQGNQPVALYLFWGDGCPHCAAEKEFLPDLVNRYPNLEVRQYEIWYQEQNRELAFRMAESFGFEPSAVPITFIGERYWVGFSDQIAAEFEAEVARCSTEGCPDAGQGIIPGLPTPAATPAQIAEAPEAAAEIQKESTVITLPWIGQVNLASHGLLASTAIIAFVDGFNPCSLWVLSVLLALTLHTGSRKKVLVVGLIFLTVTSLVYVAFIAGLFTVFTFAGRIQWISVIIALVALVFAVINIKDYFWYKEGVSLTISDEKKPGIYAGIRRVVNARSYWGLIGATIVLAAGVSVVEFSCTAGFPVLWTNLLSQQGVGTGEFILLLLVYMLIYQLDELAIFLFAVFTLRASRLEEKHGRILKLAGGMLMLFLAMVMLINPSIMNELSGSLLIFAGAFGATALVLVIHRQLLPRLGIHIGTELQPPAKRSAYRKKGRRANAR